MVQAGEGRTGGFRGLGGNAVAAVSPAAGEPISTPMRALLAGGDAVRAAVFRWLLPQCPRLFADRARRVAWLGGFSVLLAFGLTVTVPLWMLALGPLLLGVPHLLADLRYLVVVPGLHRRPWLCVAAGLPLAAVGLGAPAAVGLLAVAAAVLCARGAAPHKAAALGAWLMLTIGALADETLFVIGFLHLHNVVALGLWWFLRPRDGRTAAVLLLVAVGSVLLIGGAMDPVVAGLGGWIAPATGIDIAEHAQVFVPMGDPVLAQRGLLCFAFLQAVHYAVWLRLVPEDARARPVPRSFRASWLALRDDLGARPLALAAALAIGLALWGACDLVDAREGYLRLAAFHGYLELAVIALLFVERRRPATP